jgi:hypothetical protein
MKKMMPATMGPGATTAEVRLIVPCPIIPAPAATNMRRKVPYTSEKRRRHS